MLANFDAVASFEEARSIAASPDGLMYVVDAGSSTIHQFDQSGTHMMELGGPGAEAGQFDEPWEIDPTNGLILVVADAGNGRIQRFSREFLFLEALPVGRDDRADAFSPSGGPKYRQANTDGLGGDGRPVAVRTTSDNRMFAIDAEEQVVVEWDPDRNITRVIGQFNEGDGALMNPVSLEIGSNGSLFVLDADQVAVKVYDAFGGYIRDLGSGLVADAARIKRIGSALVILLPSELLVFHERGMLEYRIEVTVDDPLVDILYNDERLYLLTSKALVRCPGDIGRFLKL